jgi:dihydrofolate synthase / folylpolyglutamate synthase
LTRVEAQSTAADDALAPLRARGRLGVRLGLGRTRTLLGALGDPHRSLRGALIGGTNGKGSTQALVAGALRGAGLRVGQTPKPHLSSYRERIVVDGEAIGEADLAAMLREVLDAAEGLERRHGPATEFEILTACAFLWLARCRVDVAVVEVGLGGRLDATNAWDGGVAAVTNVGLDHQELLGASVEAIAREKAAIIKRGDLAVTGAHGPALRVISRRAARLGVPLRASAALEHDSTDLGGTTLHHPRLGSLRVGLLGRHQAANAAVALGVLEALAEAGIADAADEVIRAAFGSARWPGRLELLEADGVPVLLDGAHNVDGAMALAEAIEDLRPHLPAGRAALLLGAVREKDVAAIVAALAASPMLHAASVTATSVPGTDRGLEPSALAVAWTGAAAPRTEPDPAAAVEAALEDARRSGGALIVAGSLYLVGFVRQALTGEAVPTLG